MTWRCALGFHDTHIVCDGMTGMVVCRRRCGYVEGKPWTLIRPERAALEARQRDQLKLDRERRAARMGRPYLVPFQRRVR